MTIHIPLDHRLIGGVNIQEQWRRHTIIVCLAQPQRQRHVLQHHRNQ